MYVFDVYGVVEDLLMFLFVDHSRHPDPHLPPTNPHRPLRTHPLRHTPRVHRERQLRLPAPRNMVAQAIADLLPWPYGHEDLRADHIPRATLDIGGRRLGAALDGGQRGVAGYVCDACFSTHHECHAVLYHRYLYSESEAGA